MKRISNYATWIFADDVDAGIKQIKSEEARSLDRQEVNRFISDIGETVLILAAVAVVWGPLVMLLWP